jgi:hypothetical protein
VIGNSTPRYNFGLSGGFTWKGFGFNMRWQGIGKREWHPRNSDIPYYGMNHSSIGSALLEDSYHLDYWRASDHQGHFGSNTDAHLPKPYFSNETFKNRQTQTRFLEDARYVRLKSLRIGYTIPQELSSTVGIQRANIYFTGENLLTWQSLPNVFDPETLIATDPSFGGWSRNDAGMAYPLQRIFSLGVNLTF